MVVAYVILGAALYAAVLRYRSIDSNLGDPRRLLMGIPGLLIVLIWLVDFDNFAFIMLKQVVPLLMIWRLSLERETVRSAKVK